MSKNRIYLSKEVEFDDDILARVTDAIDKTMSYLLDDEGYSANLIITSDEEIREINKEQREIDRATDVLSFPIWNFCEPCFCDEDMFEEEDGTVLLGDIIISADTSIRQAEEFGHSLLREVAFLSVHSVLHLVGYDHIEDDDRALMEEKQREIMDLLEIYR